MVLPAITLNGAAIQQPTEHGWVPPGSLGTGGAGNEVIPGIWSYVLSWNALAPADFQAIYNIWYDNQGTDIAVQIPELGAATYVLAAYTCRINPVIFRGFFEGHYLSVQTELIGLDITA